MLASFTFASFVASSPISLQKIRDGAAAGECDPVDTPVGQRFDQARRGGRHRPGFVDRHVYHGRPGFAEPVRGSSGRATSAPQHQERFARSGLAHRDQTPRPALRRRTAAGLRSTRRPQPDREPPRRCWCRSRRFLRCQTCGSRDSNGPAGHGCAAPPLTLVKTTQSNFPFSRGRFDRHRIGGRGPDRSRGLQSPSRPGPSILRTGRKA